MGNTRQIELEIVRGRARQKRRHVAGPAFLIGGGPDCDLVLAGRDVPGVYAYLALEADGVTVRHLGAGPDLYVNDKRVPEAKLQDGDRLRAGPYEFVIHITKRTRKDDSGAGRCGDRTPALLKLEAERADSAALLAAARLVEDIRATLADAAPALRRPA